MTDFQILSIKLTLLSSSGNSVPGLPVIVQYYSFEDRSWVNLYAVSLNTKGALSISSKERTGMPPEEVALFETLHNTVLPPIRVIPAEGYEDLVKQPVIGSTFSANLISGGTLEINFGVLWLAPEELIKDSSTRFTDFLPITSHFKIAPPVDKTPLPINQLYSNLVSEIETATNTSESSTFKLSNISLKLKAMIQRDGDTVSATLLDSDSSENVNGNAISELVFDITSNQTSEAASLTMPDVSGLTETAVRRVLKSFNLRLNPVYQNNLTVVNGDSFKQSPAEGETIQPNQLVTVIFSKHEQSK
ncbi:PASTA domain-containing protein [Fluviicola sp.]|uniref:PASTA domain-containing protein n=1 Tax=Fluviicola sp. TaxID=1917219 RepID=UPI002637B34C|nr:PASTA domain-containing protein [Fluviicola sp.]